MSEATVLRTLEGNSEAAQIAQQVITQPDLLPEVFEGLNAQKATIKYGCLKILREISEKEPALLYPWIDFFFDLLDSDSNVFKWGAILIIGNLAVVDSEDRIEANFERFFAPISGPVMITAGNTIGAAARIAVAKPHLRERITWQLLKVKTARYQTPECWNIVLGHTINAFDQFFDQIEDREPVVELITQQLANPRSGTQKKTEKFVRRHKLGL